MKKYYYALALIVVGVGIFLATAKRYEPETAEISIPIPDGIETSRPGENPDSQSAETITEPDSELLLPDLQVKTLDNAYIIAGAGGKKMLRFPGTFMNTGDGKLELIGTSSPESNSVRATQRIYKKSGAPEERPVGNFVFHPTHKHWHFEDFVEFEILSLKNGSEPDQRLIGTGKMTFCIHDYAPLPEDFPGKPASAVYPWCDSSADVQGISVGWVDTYTADIIGQELDISDISDGTYVFRTTVDPENLITEKSENNNVSISFIEIAGNTVRILPAPPL